MRKLIVITALLAIGVALPAVAPAKNNPGVMRTGVCSGLGASWKLKAKHDDGRVETEFEVDQNRNGIDDRQEGYYRTDRDRDGVYDGRDGWVDRNRNGIDDRYEHYAPGHWHDQAMRDPWVMRDPKGGWIMFFTGRKPGVEEPNAGGVIGFATSPDLYDWTLQDPVYAGGTFGQMEVPQD